MFKYLVILYNLKFNVIDEGFFWVFIVLFFKVWKIWFMVIFLGIVFRVFMVIVMLLEGGILIFNFWKFFSL